MADEPVLHGVFGTNYRLLQRNCLSVTKAAIVYSLAAATCSSSIHVYVKAVFAFTNILQGAQVQIAIMLTCSFVNCRQQQLYIMQVC